jgi:hypothetical protein
VIDGAGEMDAGFTWHAKRIRENGKKSNLTPSSDTKLLKTLNG